MRWLAAGVPPATFSLQHEQFVLRVAYAAKCKAGIRADWAGYGRFP